MLARGKAQELHSPCSSPGNEFCRVITIASKGLWNFVYSLNKPQMGIGDASQDGPQQPPPAPMHPELHC